MKKILTILFVAAMLLTTACTKEENNENANENPTTVVLSGTQWVGVIDNDPQELHYVSGVLITHAEYTLMFSDDKNGTMSYDMTTLVDGDEYSDEDTTDITYTFDGTEKGTLVVEGEPMPFCYNRQENTITLDLGAESGDSELMADKIVFHRQ